MYLTIQKHSHFRHLSSVLFASSKASRLKASSTGSHMSTKPDKQVYIPAGYLVGNTSKFTKKKHQEIIRWSTMDKYQQCMQPNILQYKYLNPTQHQPNQSNQEIQQINMNKYINQPSIHHPLQPWPLRTGRPSGRWLRPKRQRCSSAETIKPMATGSVRG